TVSVFQESIGRQGEIRDRTTEGQHYRMGPPQKKDFKVR
ncbi:hypothetical protein Pgy4_38458, partial [Pseudomonas savastanoi pv. glycinea str. race 4]